MTSPNGRQGALRSALPGGTLTAAVLVGALALVAATGLPHRGGKAIVVLGAGGSAGLAAAPSAAAPTTFGIAGSVGGLYPGDSAPLRLKLRNPYGFAIVVTSISTAVSSAGPKCVSGNLTVPAFTGQVKVPARGQAQTFVTVTLRHKAPDGCQGAVFPLSYSGIARKA